MSNDKETETPLTDAEEIHPDCDDSCLDIYYRNPQGDLVKVDGWVVDAEFARDLERQLAEAKKDAERLDWLLGSDWICIDHEYWNPGKEQYQTKLLESRQAIDTAMREGER